MTKRMYPLAASLALYLSTFTTAGALSLGPVTVRSHLLQPLDAEIELRGAETLSANDLQVQLGSVEDFKRLQIPRTSLATKLHFAARRKGRRWVVHVTSTDPVEQPYLEFALRIEEHGTGLIRPVILLLDPADFDASRAPIATGRHRNAPGTEADTTTRPKLVPDKKPAPSRRTREKTARNPVVTPLPKAVGKQDATPGSPSPTDDPLPRIRRLEAQVRKMRELLKFKDQQIATMQSIIDTQRVASSQFVSPANSRAGARSVQERTIPAISGHNDALTPDTTNSRPGAASATGTPPHPVKAQRLPATAAMAPGSDHQMIYWGLVGAFVITLVTLLRTWQKGRRPPASEAPPPSRARTASDVPPPVEASPPPVPPSLPEAQPAVATDDAREEEPDSELTADSIGLELEDDRYGQELADLWEHMDTLDIGTDDSSLIDTSSLLPEPLEDDDQGLEIMLEMARAYIELGEKDEASAILQKALSTADSKEKRSRIQTVLQEIA